MNDLWFKKERFVMQKDKSNPIRHRDLVFRSDLKPNPDPDLHRSRTVIQDPSVFEKFFFFYRDMSRWDTYQPFDPVPPTGDTIMEESWLLCLDEFMVRKKNVHTYRVGLCLFLLVGGARNVMVSLGLLLFYEPTSGRKVFCNKSRIADLVPY